MIVSTMNTQQIANEIARDYKMVSTKGEYLTKSLRRMAFKSKDKCACGIFDYKSKNHNKWIIICGYKKKRQFFRSVIYYIDKYGFNAIIYDDNIKSLTHLTPHFLSRYNERFLQQPNLSKLEILKIYIEKNSFGLAQHLQDTDEIENQIFLKNDDGIGLGFYEYLNGPIPRICHLKTFITDDMTKGNQEDFLAVLTQLHRDCEQEILRSQSNRFVA